MSKLIAYAPASRITEFDKRVRVRPEVLGKHGERFRPPGLRLPETPANRPNRGYPAIVNQPTSLTTPCASPADEAQWFLDEVHPHDRQLKAYLRGSFPGVRDVEDVVQESYLRVWKARAVQPIESAKGFLFRVARNVALDFLRRSKSSPVHPLGDFEAMTIVDELSDVSGVVDTNEKIRLLAEALEVLPARCREIVILCKLQGHSYRDVALKLALSEKTVAEHVYRGVQRLGEELQRRGVHHFGP